MSGYNIMASTHEHPNDTVFWKSRGIDQIELFMANNDVNNFDNIYTVLDESLIKGIIIDYLIVPQKLDIYDVDIGDQSHELSSRLDAALLDYMRSRVDREQGRRKDRGSVASRGDRRMVGRTGRGRAVRGRGQDDRIEGVRGRGRHSDL